MLKDDAALRAAPLAMRWEGFASTPYLCPAGYWTIGYGRLCKADAPATTEEVEARHIRARLVVAAGRLLELSPVLADQPVGRLAALASFIDNLGLGRYRASTLRRKVDARDWAGAALEFHRWVMAGGRKLPGLVARRADEAAMFTGSV